MDAILRFFSDLILFSAGLVVATIWLILIIIAIDDAIDLFVKWRSGSFNDPEEDDS